MMNDARRWRMVEDIKRVCAALGIGIDAGSELISLVKAAKAPDKWDLYHNVQTVEEAWSFLQGYCNARGLDVWTVGKGDAVIL